MDNILIVDDHPQIRKYVILLLRDEYNKTTFHESDNEEHAWTLLCEIPMDLVILDLQINKDNGFVLAQRIREKFPHMPILINSQHTNSDCMQRAIQLEINGYIDKRDRVENLIKAVHSIQQGVNYYSESILPLLLNHHQNKENLGSIDPLSLLSQREKEVFTWLGKGLGKFDIAKQMDISKYTVETHIERIRRKLHIESGKKLEHYATRIAHQNIFHPDNPGPIQESHDPMTNRSQE